ncbi:hypothetical protein ACT3T8_18050 [Halomonas sp. AOP1-B1-8]|uniref:hypothetical protein n=1 Tax=Halomonas sp. AOP1-B1-8 TaxID=3457726 RepID=UPI0040336475
MNPLAILFLLAPGVAIGVLLFVWVYEDQSGRVEIERQKHEVRQLEFEKDFADAWNGGTLEGPSPEQIASAKAELEAAQTAKQEREQERCEKMSSLAADIDPSSDRSGSPSC